jgi:hypothetical protein
MTVTQDMGNNLAAPKGRVSGDAMGTHPSDLSRFDAVWALSAELSSCRPAEDVDEARIGKCRDD